MKPKHLRNAFKYHKLRLVTVGILLGFSVLSWFGWREWEKATRQFDSRESPLLLIQSMQFAAERDDIDRFQSYLSVDSQKSWRPLLDQMRELKAIQQKTVDAVAKKFGSRAARQVRQGRYSLQLLPKLGPLDESVDYRRLLPKDVSLTPISKSPSFFRVTICGKDVQGFHVLKEHDYWCAIPVEVPNPNFVTDNESPIAVITKGLVDITEAYQLVLTSVENGLVSSDRFEQQYERMMAGSLIGAVSSVIE